MNYYFLINNSPTLTPYSPSSLPSFLHTINSSTNFYTFYPTLLNNNGFEETPANFIKSTVQLSTIVPQEPKREDLQLQRKKRRRQRNFQRELVSAKKNSESNIINHYFSFFMLRECSQNIVKRIINSLKKTALQIQKIIKIFYNIIRLINIKRGRKYINKVILNNYFSNDGLLELIDNTNGIEVVSLDDLSRILRKSFYFFISEISFTAILTSKRITKHSRDIHLNKRRKISNFLLQDGNQQ